MFAFATASIGSFSAPGGANWCICAFCDVICVESPTIPCVVICLFYDLVLCRFCDCADRLGACSTVGFAAESCKRQSRRFLTVGACSCKTKSEAGKLSLDTVHIGQELYDDSAIRESGRSQAMRKLEHLC